MQRARSKLRLQSRRIFFSRLLTLHNSSEKRNPAHVGYFVCLSSSRPEQNEKALDWIFLGGSNIILPPLGSPGPLVV